MSLFDQAPISLDLPGADIIYYPDFIEPEQPRLTALYADNEKPYSYSNITMYPSAFTFALSEIKKRIEAIADTSFTTCLLNLYRDGKDSNGWHSDDEKELGINPVIASISLGARRVFKLRNKEDYSLKTQLILDSGSLLLMKGETQHNWQHQIPKTQNSHTYNGNLISLLKRCCYKYPSQEHDYLLTILGVSPRQ